MFLVRDTKFLQQELARHPCLKTDKRQPNAYSGPQFYLTPYLSQVVQNFSLHDPMHDYQLYCSKSPIPAISGTYMHSPSKAHIRLLWQPYPPHMAHTAYHSTSPSTTNNCLLQHKAFCGINSSRGRYSLLTANKFTCYGTYPLPTTLAFYGINLLLMHKLAIYIQPFTGNNLLLRYKLAIHDKQSTSTTYISLLWQIYSPTAVHTHFIQHIYTS